METLQIRAAEYMRMSTEHQQYSIANQSAAIQEYANAHSIEIVRTFVDRGKSGLALAGRLGLKDLFHTVAPDIRFPAMRNLARRLQKLEAGRFDATRLVPHSEVWFAYWEDKLARSMDGEDVDMSGFTLAVIDRIIEEADREEQARIQ